MTFHAIINFKVQPCGELRDFQWLTSLSVIAARIRKVWVSHLHSSWWLLLDSAGTFRWHSEHQLLFSQTKAAVSRTMFYLCTPLYPPTPSMHWCVKVYGTLSSSITECNSWQRLDCTALIGLHRPQSVERRPRLNTASLCTLLADHCWVSGSGPRKSVQCWDTCGGTVNVSVTGPQDGNGSEHAVIHQSSMALLPFRHRHPLRHKDPAASSGRLTHNIEH